jgi:F0F1-type ATP synthase membrane subunit b/b'
MGVANLQAGTLVDKDTHTAFIRDIRVTSVRFPGLDAQAAAQMEQTFRQMVPSGGEAISVDRLIADLDKKNTVAGTPVAVETDPPQIFYSKTPAILLLVDGKPVPAPIEKTDLQYVVNTNWNLILDKDKKNYFLAYDRGWLTARELQGPWEPTQKLPKDMSKLPADQTWAPVKKLVPPPAPSGAVPHVFFSDKPAELILTKGDPVYSKIAGTHLFYIANTDNDVFLDDNTKQLYVLLSGRWFRSASADGPWTYAGNDLPQDFAKIPPNSPKGAVLASVPGTIQAQDAVMLAQIPTTAVVNKAEAEAKVKVAYDGDPQFKPIENTSLQYATNTEEKVIKVGDLYYLCFQGVWFMSKDPKGPWKTADSVPKEIYTIPASSPVYNVTYVTQTSTSNDEVECNHTAGYLGMFVIGMTAGLAIGYGTGYYYPPYVYWGGGYPVYRGWPATYGVGAVYNPYNGSYRVGRAAYGPYGGAGGSAWYNPSTGRYGRSASVQGYYGGRSAASAYNPWTGARGSTVQGHNAYAQWGRSAAVRGDQWAQTGHVSTARGTTTGFRSSEGAGVARTGANGTVARTTNGVYAGNDGNVYRRNSSGNWSQYNDGNWNQVQPTAQQQQNAQNARQQAQQNVQNARQQGTQPAQGDRSQAAQNLQGSRDQAQQNIQNARDQGQLPQNDRTQTSQNLQGSRDQAQQNIQSAREQGAQLPQSDRTQAAQNLQNSRSTGSSPAISQQTRQGLDNAASARQSGQTRTQQFQRSGGGARSGGFRGGGRRR